MKVTFVRKPICLKDVVEGTRLLHRFFGPGRCSGYVAAERHMTREEWEEFTSNLHARREWIQEFSNQEHPYKGEAEPCIRVTSDSSEIALLVSPQGSDYAFFVAIQDPA